MRASLDYRVSFRTAGATQRKPVLKNQRKKRKEKRKPICLSVPESNTAGTGIYSYFYIKQWGRGRRADKPTSILWSRNPHLQKTINFLKRVSMDNLLQDFLENLWSLFAQSLSY